MNKIAAIKIVKDTAKLGLLESKNLVEAIMPLLQMERSDIQTRVSVLTDQIQTWKDRTPAYSMLATEIDFLQQMVAERAQLRTLLGLTHTGY